MTGFAKWVKDEALRLGWHALKGRGSCTDAARTTRFQGVPRCGLLLCGLLAVALVGCGDREPAGRTKHSAPANNPPATQPSPSSPAPTSPVTSGGSTAVETMSPKPDTATPSPAPSKTSPADAAPAADSSGGPSLGPANPSAVSPEPPREKAQVGVGEKGRNYPAGMYAPQTYWAIREKAVFEIQIPKAMQLFKATEGRAPKDHAEYMQRIIKENMIKLPDLPPGDRYVYDPKREELMVEHTGQ